MNKLSILILVSFLALAFAASDPIFLNETYYTGYVNLTQDRGQLWWWLFESRQSPANDPLIISLDNSAARAAAWSVLTQNGPFVINDDNVTLSSNPNSWNNFANVLYADALLATGFSNANSLDAIPTNSSAMADDIITLLQQFLQDRPEYQGRDLYIAGQGFAAHPIIWTCSKILNNTASLGLNLKGWQVNTPYLYLPTQYESRLPYALKNDLINQSFYDELLQNFTVARELLSHADNETDLYEGSDDVAEITSAITDADPNNLINYYNIKQSCFVNSSTIGCYDFDNVVQFMNQSAVIAALNITENNWGFYNFTALYGVTFVDWNSDLSPLAVTLLNSGLKAVLYCGEYSFADSCDGVQQVINQINWNGQSDYNNSNFVEWGNNTIDKHLDNFTFVRVNGSGYFVGLDRPDVALNITNNLITGDW